MGNIKEILKKDDTVILKDTNKLAVVVETPVDGGICVMIAEGGNPARIVNLNEVVKANTGKKEIVNTTTATSYPLFMKGDAVYVKLLAGGKMSGTVTTNSYVRQKEVEVDGVFIDKSTVEVVAKVVYPAMYLNKKIRIKVKGAWHSGTVHTYSGTSESMVKLNVPTQGTVTILKSSVEDEPPYVAPKHYFKDHKKATVDEKAMASLFQAKKHDDVIKLALTGVDITKFDITVDTEYTAMIPIGLKATDKIPLLIAHTDLHPSLTHPTADNLEYDGNIFKSSTGLGADDRAGVFAINKLLRKYPGKFMVLFPDKEEIGLVGSKKFANGIHFPGYNKYASMFISIDRRREFSGAKTLATYGCDDTKLNTWVAKATTRTIVRGSSTDCKALADKSTTNVPCFNLSCGYTGEHSVGETLRFDELIETIKDLEIILTDERSFETYKYKAPVTKSYSNNHKHSGYYGGHGFQLDECVELNGSFFYEDDVQALLDLYAFYTGTNYSTATNAVNAIVPEIEVGDYARLDTTMAIGHSYGGEVFTADIKHDMDTIVWEVEKIGKNGRFDLVAISDEDTSSCSSIPRRWLNPITKEAPLIIK